MVAVIETDVDTITAEEEAALLKEWFATVQFDKESFGLPAMADEEDDEERARLLEWYENAEMEFLEMFGDDLRMNPYHSKTDGKFTSGSGGTAVKERPAAKRITAAQARGNSRPVSEEEFDRIANEGKEMLAERLRNRAPATGLEGENWETLKEKTYAEVQQPWGGATIDSHTGVPLISTADKYALTIKPEGLSTVSVPENASSQEFHSAMDTAKSRFGDVLQNEGSHLGVFHDDENRRIDIDPVVVVDTLHEVDAIGAHTYAIGGAYHFKSGDGFWPPHVADSAQRAKSILLGEDVHWIGPGEWLSFANEVQRPFVSRHLRNSVGATRANPYHDKLGKFASGSGGGMIVAATTYSGLSTEGKAAVREAEKKYGVTRARMAKEIESKLTPQNIADGKAWYQEAHAFNRDLADRSGLSHEQCAAITAAISPRTPWPRNKALAERVAMKWKDHPDIEPTFRDRFGRLDTPTEAAARKMGGCLVRTNLAPALAIARAGSGDQHAVIDKTLTGIKRRSFYNNMVDPKSSTDITVDTWMLRAATNASTRKGGLSIDDAGEFLDSNSTVTNGGAGYVSISEAIRTVADKRGLTPHEVQAAYWIAVSGSKDGARDG